MSITKITSKAEEKAVEKRIYTAAGLFLAAALVLGGCGKEKVPESEFATADEAKEALTSAETIEIYFDLYGSKRKTKIVADGKVAGYLQKNTVYINEEEWFSIDYVEDEPINDREGSGTTYGYTTHPVRVLAMRRSSMWIPPMEKIQD